MVEDDGTVAWVEVRAYCFPLADKTFLHCYSQGQKRWWKNQFFTRGNILSGPDPVGLIEGFVKGHICWDPGLKNQNEIN